MESHIKYIGNLSDFVRGDRLITSIDDVFKLLSDEDKLRYMLQQALLISYYSWLYDARSNEFMYRYAVSLKEYIYKTQLNLEGVYVQLRSILDSLVYSWFSNNWKDVPIKLVIGCVADTANFNYPTVAAYVCNEDSKERQLEYEKDVLRSLFVPYLMFRNHHLEEGYAVWNKKVRVPKFMLDMAVSSYDRSNHRSGHYSIYSSEEGIGFFARFEDKINTIKPGLAIDTLMQHYVGLVPYLEFVCQMQFGSNRKFDTILRSLAYLNLSMDEFSKFTANSNLFYDSDVVLHDMFAIDFATRGGYKPIRDARTITENIGIGIDRHLIKTFRILCELDDFKFSSHTLFDRFFSGLCSNSCTKQLLNYCRQYLIKEGPTPASEALDYKASDLGGLEAIQLFSQYDSGQTESSEEQEEPETSGDEVDLDIDENFEEGVAEPGLEADENDDPPTPEEGKGDSSTDGDQDADDSSPDSGDDNPDDPAVEEDNSSQDAGDSTTDQSVTQTTGTPEEIDASDTDGIPFEISAEGSETVDSVMIREEIDQFITNILVNPPKELSPQSVAALTTLQKCWVHLLTVETVVRILDRLVAIPEKFKNIITQVELKQDE